MAATVSEKWPKITMFFVSLYLWTDFVALLAKGQKSLCDGLSSVRPSVRPLATSPQKLFFFVAQTRWPPLLKIAEIYYCLLLWIGLMDFGWNCIDLLSSGGPFRFKFVIAVGIPIWPPQSLKNCQKLRCFSFLFIYEPIFLKLHSCLKHMTLFQ